MEKHIYKAMANQKSIVTVIAIDADDAIKKVEDQLDRPGRYAYLKIWRDQGQQVECQDGTK